MCHVLSRFLITPIFIAIFGCWKVIAEYVYPNHFGMASTEAEGQEARRWMEPVTHVYSKGMATLQEGAVSKASSFSF